MRNCRFAVPASVCFTAVLSVCMTVMFTSCSNGARIEGVIADAPSSDVEVRLLDVNRYIVLDTVKTDKSGAFKYKVPVGKGRPEFIYLFRGDTRVASLLLQKGDRVKVSADTLGNYSVTGSPETEKLISVERDEADFAAKFIATTARLDDLDPSSEEAVQVRRDLAKQYIAYYRSRVIYLMDNPYSLTVIPVLYQQVAENLPLFSQPTDAIHFRNACDSLKKVYPDSRYVKALEEETRRRQHLMDLNMKIQSASESGYPDLELPDIRGQKVRLSSIDAKIVIVYFWTASSAGQKMMNLDFLLPVYETYRDKGLEIYAVSLDTDKGVWANAVKNQKLNWVNVCDGLGTASPALTLYNVPSVPYAYLIKDGDLVTDANVSDEASLRKYLKANL
ncbi:MAG: redoxin domain-containing protein [Candidatus Cryptobacteroides sp.]